jgi:NAD(P)-dependent dehydrogenase (short-subunit alcohol dehydrogenase family)
MNRVQNKVVIVTGGSLGIGRAACLLLAREGARVAVTDILDAEGRALAERIQAEGGQAGYWHMDTSKEEEVQQAFQAIAQTFGGIDVLVNNAGIGGANKPTHEITREEWDHVMAINVNGVFYCTKHAIPYMLKAGAGSIINLSSIYGLVGAPDAPPYHASKGAVRLMAKTDAMLYAKNQIRVNSIHPGYIWTPLVENAMKAQGLSAEEAKSALANLHPLGYVGDPDDIAYGIVYLASDESRFVTGSELVIDGGYTAH